MLPNIEILRAVAAYLVVFVHLKTLLPETSITAALHEKAYWGVDLFFVISGFIMVYTTSRKKISGSEFLFNRVQRIVPLYYLTTYLVFVIAIFFPLLLQSSSSDLYALLKSLAFIPFEKSAGRIYPVYYLGWTLNYEMFFYLLFALSLAIWYEMRVVLCATVMMALVLLGLFVRPSEDVILYFYSQSIMLDFVLGMFLGVFREQVSAAMRRMSVLSWLALSLGLGLLVAFSYLPAAPTAYAPPTNTLLTFGIPAALIVMAAIGFEDATTRGQPWQLLQEIGNASYSVYLTHFFVIGGLSAFASRADLSPGLRALLALMAIPLTAILGIVVHRYFERPVMAILRRRNPLTKPVVRT